MSKNPSQLTETTEKERIEAIILELHEMSDPSYISKMEYFGIKGGNALGIRNTVLKSFAKKIGRNQALADLLWNEPIHEAKHLACWISEAKKITEQTVEKWTCEAYSWDLVDTVGTRIVPLTNFCYAKVEEWSAREAEFEKRMAFATIVGITLRHKKEPDERIASFLSIIEREAHDDRNFVKKAVNWALRQIGKRSFVLNEQAIVCAERILTQDTKPAKWIARDALRELKSEAVQARLILKS